MTDWSHVLGQTLSVSFAYEIDQLYMTKTVFPPKSMIFNALQLTPVEKVKAVILGQDPYHQPGQAMGLAFSVPNEVKIPPSLRNIYKELAADISQPIRRNGNLSDWAKQGVLLLNTVLTVEEGKPASHAGIGWEKLTDNMISAVNNKADPVAFIFWGNHARAKRKLITNERHLVLESAHPSPLSANRGFFGSKPFSKTNDFLIKNHLDEIKWS